jgi:sigma-B regulation protein RsbU (phosphoserine phosphatase)
VGTTEAKGGARFRERAELLDFLLDVSTATSETLDLDRILANVAEIVKEVVPYDLFAILLYSEKRAGLRILHSIGHREEVIKSLVIPLGEGITGLAASRRQPMLIPDVRKEPEYLNALDAVRSELAAPMVARGKLVGVIDLQSTRLNAYNQQDRALVMLIASRVAVSIDNARLYRRVERQNRTLRTLAHLSREFGSILALDELLGKIAKTIHAMVNFDAFSVLLVDQQKMVLRHRFSERYDERVELDNIPIGKGITGAAAESREPVVVADTLADPRYIASHPDIRSEVAIPLIMRDRVIGVMDLESERLGYFTEDHVRLLALLGPQIASSVENARLYEELALSERGMEQDLKAARKLQSVLLPKKVPPIPGLEAALRSRPAREITGDLFDFYEYDATTTLIAFGDVSGKGAAAALYGALVSGLLRTLAPQRRGPAELMKALNEALLERKVDAQYVSLALLKWESAKRRLTMANSGAVPPVILRNGEAMKLKVEGVPLGLLEEREYEDTVFEAKAGDLIMLVSDGVLDQPGANKEPEFGQARLGRVLSRTCRKPAAQIVESVLQELDRFAGDTARFDDQTLLAMRVVNGGVRS